MCTSIVEIVGAEGTGKGEAGWFALTHSVVSYGSDIDSRELPIVS